MQGKVICGENAVFEGLPCREPPGQGKGLRLFQPTPQLVWENLAACVERVARVDAVVAEGARGRAQHVDAQPLPMAVLFAATVGDGSFFTRRILREFYGIP